MCELEINSEDEERRKCGIETSSKRNWRSCVWGPAKDQGEDGTPIYKGNAAALRVNQKSRNATV